MFDKRRIDLPVEEKSYFYYRTGKIKSLGKEIQRLLDEIEYKKINLNLLPQEGKRFKDDKEWNLFLATQFILEGNSITPENLRNLYEIISKNVIDLEEQSMGEFYRNTREYIYHVHTVFPDYTEAVSPENIDEYMKHYFDYIQKEEDLTPMDIFLKSQILHLYFVYVHPYLDGNGRSARLVSSWYLINENQIPFLLSNKVIDENKNEYSRMIRKSIDTKDCTHYLFYIMKALKKELEKVIQIDNIERELEVSLSDSERRMLEILLSKKKISIKDLGKDAKVDEQIIYPFLEKGIIIEEEGYLSIPDRRKEKNSQYGG